MTSLELLEKALSLSPTDRVALIEQLYKSFNPDDSDKIDEKCEKCEKESDSRLQAIENGEMTTSSAKNAFSRINEQGLNRSDQE